jgi:hypothetical protein
MFTLFVALLSLYGFITSVIVHVLTFFLLGDLNWSIVLLVGAMLLAFPGFFVYPGALPPYDRSIRANYNFWRLIPKKWIRILGYVGLYSIVMTVITAVLFQQNNFLPMPYSARMASGMAMALFFLHTLGYWYHAPVEAREKLISLLHLIKKKHHRKRN